MSLWLRFNAWCDSNPRLSAMLFAVPFLLLLMFLFYGCSARPLPPGSTLGADGQPEYGLGAQLASVGGYFTWIGLIISGLALVACIVFPIARPIAILAGEAGGGAALVGGLFVWLADNIWLIVLSCVVAGLGYAWYRRALLLRWWTHLRTKV